MFRVPGDQAACLDAHPQGKGGQLLCPNLFNETGVQVLEKTLGSYGADGQLQQRPVPRAGGMFQRAWFTQIVDVVPTRARRLRYRDRAATAGGGCYTCGVSLAWTAEGLLLCRGRRPGGME
jgi:hypothetical protein